MKFDELCDFVLVNEAHRDYLTGKSKVYSLSNDASEIINDVSDKWSEKITNLLKKTKLPITDDYMVHLFNELQDYLPAEVEHIRNNLIARDLRYELGATEASSKKSSKIIFAFLEDNKIVVPGIPKEDEEPSEDDIESLTKELEGDIEDPDYKGGLSTKDVETLGGVLPRSTGHAEDESEWY